MEVTNALTSVQSLNNSTINARDAALWALKAAQAAKEAAYCSNKNKKFIIALQKMAARKLGQNDMDLERT